MGKKRTPLSGLVERRLARRDLLRGLAAVPPLVLLERALGRPLDDAHPLRFEGVPQSMADTVVAAPGHVVDVLLAWGDPVLAGAPSFDWEKQSPARQATQFGFNCDYNAFLPLAPGSSERGLLCVNHEYTSRGEMFPGRDPDRAGPEEVAIELEAHGMSIVEVARDEDGRWRRVKDSRYHRRITGTSRLELSGPAAGSPGLKTAADPSGRAVRGMLNNCSGGKTPWGTVLSCEENVHKYFGHSASLEDEAQREALAAYGYASEGSLFRFEQGDPRFDLRRTPNEPNRFGWIVEVDPFDPESRPRKHTALGRFCHEGAATVLANDGRVVVYSGDDELFQYVYKFVSRGRLDPGRRASNLRLLETGTLYVARFEDDGSGVWLPLVPGGPLAGWTQARILTHARLAASLLGATPMDRPEDVEVHPGTGRVYVALTKNRERTAGDGGPNPRANNSTGHVLELLEGGGDLGATRFAWEPFLVCGDPERHADTLYGKAGAADPLACPDNLAFDLDGNLWITTDGQWSALGANDALYVVPTEGEYRGVTKRFLTAPVGAELCGPEFTPDGRTLFLGVQHPGEGRGLDPPASTWPDGDRPRPAVVTVRHTRGGRVGV